MFRRLLIPLLLLAVIILSSPADAQTPSSIEQDYEALQRWEFTQNPSPVPQEGILLGRDTALWRLESGRFHLMRPTSAGQITGLVFEGRGQFRMAIPDPFELAQLRRFTEEAELTSLDVAFEQLVLRTSDGLIHELSPSPVAPYRRHRLAAKRHEEWLEPRSDDVDARILAALHDPGDVYFRVDVKTKDWGWLTYEHDGRRTEEIQLIRQHKTFPEIWLSLDQEADRTASGRPSGRRINTCDLIHIDVVADLTHNASHDRAGRSWVRGIRAKFDVGVTVEPRIAGATALTFDLHPMAEVASVKNARGEELPFLRDNVGDRTMRLDDDLYDDSIVVLLDRPLVEGEARELQFEYELDILNFVEGKLWYPTLRHNHLDRHTARLTLTARRKEDVHAMGRKVDEREDGKHRTSIWEIDNPATMITFAINRPVERESVALDGVPEIVSVGPVFGRSGGKKARKVCEDIAESIDFFHHLFDIELPIDRLVVTSIAADHVSPSTASSSFLKHHCTRSAPDPRSCFALTRSHTSGGATPWAGEPTGTSGSARPSPGTRP